MYTYTSLSSTPAILLSSSPAPFSLALPLSYYLAILLPTLSLSRYPTI